MWYGYCVISGLSTVTTASYHDRTSSCRLVHMQGVRLDTGFGSLWWYHAEASLLLQGRRRMWLCERARISGQGTCSRLQRTCVRTQPAGFWTAARVISNRVSAMAKAAALLPTSRGWGTCRKTSRPMAHGRWHTPAQSSVPSTAQPAGRPQGLHQLQRPQSLAEPQPVHSMRHSVTASRQLLVSVRNSHQGTSKVQLGRAPHIVD